MLPLPELLRCFLRVDTFRISLLSEVAIAHTVDTALGGSMDERRTKRTRCNVRRFLELKIQAAWRKLSGV
jgi:hypothetical protein